MLVCTLQRLESTVWPATSNFTFFQLPLARSLARAAFTSEAHTGKGYGNLLEKSAFAWSEAVQGGSTEHYWQDLRISHVRHFLFTSGISTQQVPLASLQARQDEWGMMVTSSNCNQIHQVVEYFDLTHGLVPAPRQFHFRLPNLMLQRSQRHQLPYAKSQYFGGIALGA